MGRPLRGGASVFVVALGVGVAVVGAFFASFDDQTGMEAALFLSWGAAVTVGRICRSKPRKADPSTTG